MVAFIDDLSGSVISNIVGGTQGDAFVMATLFLITILVAILLAARLQLELALVIVSPAIIIASFAGLLPPFGFGVIVLLLAIFWAGIIIALIR